MQATVVEAGKTSITVATIGATPTKTTYTLDPTVADPNTVVNFHGRTIHATTLVAGEIVELKLNDKTPPRRHGHQTWSTRKPTPAWAGSTRWPTRLRWAIPPAR